MTHITVPSWIACQTYFAETPKSRTIISSQKTHKTVLLEAAASDLYHFIAVAQGEGVSERQLNDYADKKGIADELDAFIGQLKQLSLITDGTQEPDDFISTPLHYAAEKDGKRQAIEDTMSKWACENGFLWSVFIEMTYKCNCRCIHCYNPAFRGTEQLSFEKAKEIIDDAVQLGCFELTLSGGECTLDSDFIQIVEYARSKRLKVNIFTNGITLYDNPDLLKKIVSLYPYQVGISVYSAQKELHEKVTTIKGSWDKSTAVLEKLKQYGVNTQVKCVQLAETVSSWRETIELAKKYDSAVAIDVTLTPTIEGNKKTWAHLVKDEDLIQLFSAPDSPMYVGNWTEPPEIKLDRDGPCYAGSHTVCITPQLNVTGCVSLPIVFGSLKTERLYDIWTNGIKNKESELYKWQHITLDKFKDCFKEDYCRFCHFCAGMGMLEDKLFAKSELLCKLAKMKRDVFYSLKEKKGDTPYLAGVCKMK